MIVYMIMRLVYGIYFIGIAALVLRAISSLVFKKKMSFKDFIFEVGFAVIWPLGLFTPAGRKRLKQSLPFFKD